MKYLLLLLLVAVAVWWLRRSQRVPGPKKPEAPSRSPPPPTAATPMLACAHCGVHLPQAEAVTDAEGRPFCGAAHRLAGPR